MYAGLDGTSVKETDNVPVAPIPQVLEGVQDNVPELFQVTETEFPVPVIVAALEGFTLQL
jgi:hypothetical protein